MGLMEKQTERMEKATETGRQRERESVVERDGEG